MFPSPSGGGGGGGLTGSDQPGREAAINALESHTQTFQRSLGFARCKKRLQPQANYCECVVAPAGHIRPPCHVQLMNLAKLSVFTIIIISAMISTLACRPLW